MRLIDITGQRFGRAVVESKAPPRKGGGSDWNCVCDCGARFTAIGANLRRGDTTSCGCAAREWAQRLGSDPAFIAKRAESQVRHGQKRRGGMTAEYATWLRMKRRCSDQNDKDYPNWGGRGIRVCQRWDQSFEAFFADMGPRPAGDYSIDRLDSSLDYEPSNCRWATLAQQAGENRRGLTPITVGGVAHQSVAAACRASGVKLTTAHNRLNAGIAPETAVQETARLPARRSGESYLPKDKR